MSTNDSDHYDSMKSDLFADVRRLHEETAHLPETESEWDSDEESVKNFLDLHNSPYQRASKYWTPKYQAGRQARRNACKRPLSPPNTPPHLEGRKIARRDTDIAPLCLDNAKMQKRKQTPFRRPLTRSIGRDRVSLHAKRGMVRYWSTPWSYVDLTYQQFQQDFVSTNYHYNHALR